MNESPRANERYSSLEFNVVMESEHTRSDLSGQPQGHNFKFTESPERFSALVSASGTAAEYGAEGNTIYKSEEATVNTKCPFSFSWANGKVGYLIE